MELAKKVLEAFYQQEEIHIKSLAKQLDADPKLTEESIWSLQELGYLIHLRHGETKDEVTYYILR